MNKEHGTDDRFSFHLSITGLRVKPGLMDRLGFQYHAVRSFIQTQKADGVLHVSAKHINGVEHTVTSWRDREAMLAFVRTGTHVKAMKAFHRIAEGSTHTEVADRIPEWTAAHTLWQEWGAQYGQ